MTKQTEKTSSNIESKKKILIMDDEKTIGLVVTRMLESIGYESKWVRDGQQALDEYKAEMDEGRPFAAVFMDLTIPGGMGGKETVEKLLQIDPDAKAVVSSGYAHDPIMDNYSDYGFKAVAAKPYSRADLRDLLDELLS